MMFTSSDASSLVRQLWWWEHAEYVFGALVAAACAGEYIADFNKQPWVKTHKDRIAKISTLVLVAALVFELICISRANGKSDEVIGKLRDEAEAADNLAHSAVQNSNAALGTSATALTQSASAITDSPTALSRAKDAAGAAARATASARQAGVLAGNAGLLAKDAKRLADEASQRTIELKNAQDNLSKALDDDMKAEQALREHLYAVDVKASWRAVNLGEAVKALAGKRAGTAEVWYANDRESFFLAQDFCLAIDRPVTGWTIVGHCPIPIEEGSRRYPPDEPFSGTPLDMQYGGIIGTDITVLVKNMKPGSDEPCGTLYQAIRRAVEGGLITTISEQAKNLTEGLAWLSLGRR